MAASLELQSLQERLHGSPSGWRFFGVTSLSAFWPGPCPLQHQGEAGWLSTTVTVSHKDTGPGEG